MMKVCISGDLDQPLQRKVDQGRPSRMKVVSKQLVPILQGDTEAELIQARPATTPRETARLNRSRKACAACQESREVPALSMAFQPIVDLQEYRIDAYEALVRGVNGEGAADMLKWATAENLYAFDQACRVKAIELAAALGIDRNLNINFLPNAVYEPRACIRATLDAAARTGFDQRRLTFEIVETEWISETSHLLNIIAEYRKMGFRVALDDFGTGYSGLARLAALKPDVIKVDRALVQDCDQSKINLAIVASLISLGAEIGVKVVLEGVERSSEVEVLRSVGARFTQGFYFAKPSFEKLVAEAELNWSGSGSVVGSSAPSL